MIKTLITINFMSTITFLFLSHPLSMGLTLMIQTIMISLILGSQNSEMWFSYMLFLIMIGGMMILFMYMTSIASNEKFKSKNSMFIIMMLTLLILIIDSSEIMKTIKSNETYPITLNKSIQESMNKYLSLPSSMMFLFIMMYLFLTLIATVKISNINQGPLRQMN